MLLAVIDAHSKLLEVHPMPTITAQATIQCLGTIFAQFVYQKKLCRTMDQPLSAGTYMKLGRFFYSHRITLQCTIEVLPAELLMGRLRPALDLVKSDIHKRVEREQEQQKATCNPHTLIRSFKVADQVYAQDYRPGLMREPGYVTELMDPRSYKVTE